MPVRLRDRLREPTVQTWLPVGLLPVALIVDAAICPDGPSVSVIGVVSAFVACLPLVLRRRASFLQLAPLLVGGIVLVLWLLRPPDTVVLIPMVALAQLASDGTRRSSAWTALAVVPCVVVSVAPFAHGTAELAQLVVRNVLLCALALAAGDVVRSRREAAERTGAAREEEALRRLGEERLRIAREVHDVVAHAMVAINVQAGVAAHLIDRDPEQARAALRHIKAQSGDALADLRATLGVLRDSEASAPVGPTAGLGDLEELAGSLRAAGVVVELAVGVASPPPDAVQAAGYRIVQEALTNVLRHGRASHVRVAVAADDLALTIDVADDGVGASTVTEGTGSGVRGMRERAEALGGTLDAGPGPSGGWTVRARLPAGARPRSVLA